MTLTAVSCYPRFDPNMHQAFKDQFYKARGRLTKDGFEDDFQKLLEKFPKSKEYMEYLYKDHHRWAKYASVLAFSCGSDTSNRVECTCTRCSFCG